MMVVGQAAGASLADDVLLWLLETYLLGGPNSKVQL